MKEFFLYHFTTQEKEALQTLLAIPISPYLDYRVFFLEIQAILHSTKLPLFFKKLCEDIKSVDLHDNPVFILRNCPIDAHLPVFDIDEPLQSKYQLKNTFISEAFLNIFAELTNNSPLGYKNINNGDHFHDVYPMRKLMNSQSQKSLVTLGFHNDLPNNIARPDWVNILCLRNYHLNRVSTTIIRNVDIIKNLDQETLAILKKPLFKTPPEVISVYGGRDENDVVHKPIYFENASMPFCYFETRTKAMTQDGESAIAKLDAVLHNVKQRVFLGAGDFISIANNHCLHAREVVEITDAEEHKKRWLQKTFNVNNIHNFHEHMVEHKFRVINE